MVREEQGGKLTRAVLVIREWLPSASETLKHRYAFARQTPGAFWALPEIRYAAFGLAIIVFISAASWILGLFQTEAEPLPYATTADFHVMCSNQECGRDFVIHRKIKFRGFPVTCSYCRQQSGCRALRRPGGAGTGQLVPTELRKDGWYEVGTDRRIRRR